MMNDRAYRIIIKGIVQGVGFRPHVYRLATEYSLTGWVLNSSAGVFMEVEGPEESLQSFLDRMQLSPPPLAVIRSCTMQAIDPVGYTDFTIKASDDRVEKTVMISPDIAICEDCQREVQDHEDRRFEYPFTNCTNCGPRFTIIKDVPYDRAKTTMASFPMCSECQAEYENPLHRRFHAQPNACPICGPQITLVDPQGQVAKEDVRELLKAGYIVAVKGLGAFHLAVDAKNPAAVKRLRQRKKRDTKPFAVMVRDLATAHRYCTISPLEESWLNHTSAPIVVMERQDDNLLAADIIHPGLKTLGVMLAYTPLHYLLFDDELEILIMTSANISDEPLIIDNAEAVEKLSEVADFFLLHNRDIFNPCDDSVMCITSLGAPQFFRRARGFVPRGIPIPRQSEPILALGGEMKNTFCITRSGEAFLSQHWGDLNHFGNYLNFQHGIKRFQKMLNVEPRILVHDMHPNYQTTRWARQQKGVERLAVQHHHAHLAAAMADNALEGEVLGLICDGTGWGSDGAVWGGEIMRGDYAGFTRLAHLQYMPLPGGDLTARKPYRMGLVYLYSALGDSGLDTIDNLLPDLNREEKNLILRKLKNDSNQLMTSSCGRLFDAVSAVLGVRSINKYEGQAAMELESCVDIHEKGHYGYSLHKEQDLWLMDILPMWGELLTDLRHKKPVGSMAQKFHLTLVEMFSAMLLKLRDETGLNQVVLSGGVFHNQVLLVRLTRLLTEQGFSVYNHHQVPAGDGGISLGQAIIASEVYKGCV